MSLILNRSVKSASRLVRGLISEDFRRVGPRFAASIPGQSIPSWIGEIVDTPQKFAVCFDVSQFEPNELQVNVSGNHLTIERNTNVWDKRESGSAKLHKSLIRKYVLPDDASLEDLHSTLSDSGQLRIETSKKAPEAWRNKVGYLEDAGHSKHEAEKRKSLEETESRDIPIVRGGAFVPS